MNRYFSTFISGTQSIVENWMYKNIKDVEIEKLWDGLVVYYTTANKSFIQDLPIFNNSFILISEYDGDRFPALDFNIDKNWTRGFKTFRIVASKENQIIKIDKNKLSKYENQISKKCGLLVDRTNPNTEIWFLNRSEGSSLVGLRITQNHNLEKVLQKGELRPQLAYLMNYFSEPDTNDVFLDLFAGHGSIPMARSKYFPAKEIIASDLDKILYKRLGDKLKDVKTANWDALYLNLVRDNSIDKIVTDPPWGVYIKDMDVDKFYSKMLAEFSRIIKNDGVVVLLTSQKDITDKLLNTTTNFSLTEKLDILVSGKKASIYKLKKL